MNEQMMTLSQVAEAVHGELTPANAIGVIRGVTTDSRAVAPDDLFVALAGEKFDGHDFVPATARAGAACALLHRALPEDPGIPVIRVADTRLALGKLAGWWRDRYQGRLVALTGSNGKTTVKEMTAAILRTACDDDAAVLATGGNFNNDIGMPLTLLKLREQHRFAVIEMGMNHLGEIDYLTGIAKPDVALINNAHRAHVGELGSMENIARAKGEIFSGLKADGVALINADDAFADYWSRQAAGRKQISFGIHNGAVRAEYSDTATGTVVRFATPRGDVRATLRVPGEHNVRNAAAACAIAVALDVSLDAISRGLAGYAGTKGRLQRKAGLGGATIIDDTYNANPDSMAAAIAVLAKASGRKIFVMGDMGELGPDAPALHAEIGALAKRAGIDTLLVMGEQSTHAVQSFGIGAEHFPAIVDLAAVLRSLLDKDTTVLVKGSRFMRMERVVEAVTTPAH